MRRSWAVPAGSAVLGITAYGFLVLAARQLGPLRDAPLAALWALVFATVPSVFNPVEQEVARRTASGEPVDAVRRQGTRAAAGLVAVALLLVAAGWPVLNRILDHDHLLLWGLAVSVLGFAATHLVRGLLLGRGEVTLYGASLALEGILRLAAASGLVLAAVSTAGPFGLVLGAAPLAATALLVAGRSQAIRGTGPGRPAEAGTPFVHDLLPLVVASVASLSLINAGPLVVKYLAAPGQAARASALLAGLALTRLPLFAFPTLQALLLPRLTRLLVMGDAPAVRALLGRLVGWGAALAVAATALVALVGSSVVRLLFGPGFELGSSDLVLLSVGTTGHLLALLLGLLLVAAGRGAALAGFWVLALLVAAVTVIWTSGLLLRVELGLVVGAWTAAAAIAAYGLSHLARASAPEPVCVP